MPYLNPQKQPQRTGHVDAVSRDYLLTDAKKRVDFG
jgi:hypothetical protein